MSSTPPSPIDPSVVSATGFAAAILRVLHANERFLICGHLRPDGDCIGSAMALYHYLAAQGKEIRVFFQPPVAEAFERIVPGMESAETEYPVDYAADVTLCVDCSSADRIVPDFAPWGLVVNIDHHGGNTRFGTINWVDSSYAAVGEMIFKILNGVPDAWTPLIASCLYLAVVTDTGAFRYSNTRAESFRIAARLVEEGADPARIATQVWGSRSLESCMIAAAVWNNLHFEVDGKLIWSEITQSIFEENGGERNEPDNLVSELIGINGTKLAILIREKPDGTARASFRSRPPADANLIARALGGGGHKQAAGLDTNLPCPEARRRIIETSVVMLAEQLRTGAMA